MAVESHYVFFYIITAIQDLISMTITKIYAQFLFWETTTDKNPYTNILPVIVRETTNLWYTYCQDSKGGTATTYCIYNFPTAHAILLIFVDKHTMWLTNFINLFLKLWIYFSNIYQN